MSPPGSTDSGHKDCESKVAQLTAELQTCRDDLEQARQNDDAHTGDVHKLQKQLSDAQAGKKELESKAAKYSKSRHMYEELLKDQARRKEQIAAAQGTEQDLQARLTDEREKSHKLRQTIMEKDDEIGRLSFNELISNGEAQAANKEIEQLTGVQLDLNEEVERLKEAVAMSDSKIEQLEETVEALDLELSEKDKEASSLLEARDADNHTIASFEMKIATLEMDLAKEKRHLENQKNHLARFELGR